MASPDGNKDVIAAHVEREPEVPREDPIDLLAHDPNVYFDVEEEKRVLRKIDWRVLPLMLGAYFLQQLDKSSLSYTSVFNIQSDANLHGKQYSWLGSILYFAQLVMQPLGALLLVKLPTGKLISTAIFFWGVTMCGMAACKNFSQLIAARFILGSFESLIGIFPVRSPLLRKLIRKVPPWLLSLKCGGVAANRQTELRHGIR
jgi:MFS family permease